MGTVLRSEKSVEVIPFSLEDPVLYYPVRHHSPACAWHLERVIERYQPDCILVEGPENANELIPILTHPDTHAPVTLYYAYRDQGRLLDSSADPKDEPDTLRCYYPFMDSSPELVALRAASQRQIPGQFIDLPYGEILLATQEAQGLRRKAEKPNYASDRYLAENQVQKALCEKAGLRDFDEFWEKYFEVGGLTQSDEDFVHQMNVYCQLARENTPAEQLAEDGCLAREAHMARRIQEAAQQYQRVLVVAGGFHLPGLLQPQLPPPDFRLPAESQMVYPMRYTLPAMDALSGYASGMPAPGFYDTLWSQLHQKETQTVWDDVVLDYLVKVARKLRSGGQTLSVFDEICALNQARGLAQLRGKGQPGLYELWDSVLSSFVKGEADLSNAEPMRQLRILTTGKRVGQLCDGALVPPLVRDFADQCKYYRLRLEGSLQQELTLMIFSKPKHRGLSRFLHQTLFLDCGFAQRKKGPDLQRRKDRNLIRELWSYRWTASVEVALIEHAVSGSTLEEACATELRQRLAGATRAGQGASLLVQGFLMGIGDLSNALADRLDRLILDDGDFASLCEACAALHTLDQWQSQYDELDSYPYLSLLGRCFDRVLQMLPSMNQVVDSQVQSVQQACLLLYQMTGQSAFQHRREELMDAFELLVSRDPIQPALHGSALGLLYGAEPEQWKSAITGVIGGYLQGTEGMVRKSAAFLQGLFFTARDLLLIDTEFLSQVDTLLSALSDEDFTALLPELRLAFSYFVPMEADRLARRAAALHGQTGGLLTTDGVSAQDYTRGEALDRWAAAQLDTMETEG